MLSLSAISEINRFSTEARQKGRSIGFVPTMGALHQGHASLVKRARAENDHVVVSVFVNPTQFGPGEDFSRYPRTLESDSHLLEACGADVLFCPSTEVMYPPGKTEINFTIREADKIMEGASRPGHFNGVLLVVSKLFHLVMPDRAYFGMKDFQQITLVKKMVTELLFPLEIIGCPTFRETDGLAMSSRNRYLNDAERKDARFLSRSLFLSREMAAGQMNPIQMEEKIRELANEYPSIQLDYFEIREADDLSRIDNLALAKKPVALIAAKCGNTRLIDNMFLFE